MNTEIIVAIITCVGSAVVAIITTSHNTKKSAEAMKRQNEESNQRMMQLSEKTLYRIEQLEKKQDKHNGVMERMVIAEENIKSLKHRMNDVEEGR